MEALDGDEKPDKEEGRSRWLEGSKRGHKPERLLRSQSAVHLGCEEIDGPFRNTLHQVSLFFVVNQICPSLVLTHTKLRYVQGQIIYSIYKMEIPSLIIHHFVNRPYLGSTPTRLWG